MWMKFQRWVVDLTVKHEFLQTIKNSRNVGTKLNHFSYKYPISIFFHFLSPICDFTTEPTLSIYLSISLSLSLSEKLILQRESETPVWENGRVFIQVNAKECGGGGRRRRSSSNAGESSGFDQRGRGCCPGRKGKTRIVLFYLIMHAWIYMWYINVYSLMYSCWQL